VQQATLEPSSGHKAASGLSGLQGQRERLRKAIRRCVPPGNAAYRL